MKTTCFILLFVSSFLLLSIPGAVSRPSLNNLSRDQLISDGVDENRLSYNIIRLRENNSMESAGEGHLSKCEQMYGFLPCSETVGGHLFLILVYEYLLFHAESYVDSGGKRIFKILGPGVCFSKITYEIYGTVVMNNVLGLAVLLSLVYFRNLAWTFSAEVLIVLIVSAIVGSFASFNTVYPVWTSVLAYFLYPLSLALVYLLGHFYVS